MFETELQALQAVFDTFAALPSTLVATGVSLAGIVLYPLVLVYDMLLGWWAYVWGIILTLITSFLRLQMSVLGFVDTVFVGSIPTPWVGLMVLMLTLNVAFRIYAFVKNIQILGFSI